MRFGIEVPQDMVHPFLATRYPLVTPRAGLASKKIKVLGNSTHQSPQTGVSSSLRKRRTSRSNFGDLGNGSRALFALRFHHAFFLFVTVALPGSSFAPCCGRKKNRISGSKTCSPKDPSCARLSKGEK